MKMAGKRQVAVTLAALVAEKFDLTGCYLRQLHLSDNGMEVWEENMALTDNRAKSDGKKGKRNWKGGGRVEVSVKISAQSTTAPPSVPFLVSVENSAT